MGHSALPTGGHCFWPSLSGRLALMLPSEGRDAPQKAISTRMLARRSILALLAHPVFRGGKGAMTVRLVSYDELARVMGTVQRSGGSCRFGKGQVGIGDPVKSMPQPGTERAVVDRATNLQQQISTPSRPSHLLGLVHAG